MQWDDARQKWPMVQRRARAKWAKLTHDDLAAISGDRDRLVNKLRECYRVRQDVAESAVDVFIGRL